MANRYDEKRFLGYVEGDLDAQERDQFEELMLQDPKLRALVMQVLDDREQLHQLVKEEPPSDLMDQVNHRLERNMLLDVPPPALNPVTPRRRLRLGRLVAFTGLAAMVLLSTGVVLYTLTNQNLYYQFTPSPDDEDTDLAQQTVDSLIIEEQSDQDTLTVAFGSESQQGPAQEAKHANQPVELDSLDLQVSAGATSDQEPAPAVVEVEAVSQEEIPHADRVRGPMAGPHESSVSSAEQPHGQEPIEAFARLTAVPGERVAVASPLADKVMKHLANVRVPVPGGTDPQAAAAAPRHQDADARDGAEPIALGVQVHSHEPQAAQHALLVWAVANHVSIVSLASAVGPDDATPQPSDRTVGNAQALRSRRVTVAMNAGWLPKLIAQLDSSVDQSARLIPQKPPWVAPQVSSQEHQEGFSLSKVGQMGWGRILEASVPLRPVVPVYDGETALKLTVYIDQKTIRDRPDTQADQP